MERPARFRSSVFIFLCVLACSQEQRATLPFFQKEKVSSYSKGGIFYANDSIFSGTLYSFYPITKDTMEVVHYLNGKEHGTWKQFYPTGKRKEIRFFVNGKKQGEYKGWWENDKPKFEFHFRDDEYEGTCRSWNAVGILTQELNYVAGHEEGAQKAWYDNGKIKSNYVIKEGRRFGLLGTKNCKNVSDSIFRAN
jgi:antitoxin component YwqK of YwqJK toxin-antitoxin module